MDTLQSLVIQEKEVLLKKINRVFFYILFSIVVFCAHLSFASDLDTQDRLLSRYLQNFSEFSASFIQSNNQTTETGQLFINNKRIKIQYEAPSKILIILSKKKQCTLIKIYKK